MIEILLAFLFLLAPMPINHTQTDCADYNATEILGKCLLPPLDRDTEISIDA